jgi:hypothetical protein
MPMDDRQKVGLGCGSLILIAVIVLVFGSIAVDGVNERILALDAKIQVLDKRTEGLQLLISDQTGLIQKLRASTRALREELRGAAQESGTQQRLPGGTSPCKDLDQAPSYGQTRVSALRRRANTWVRLYATVLVSSIRKRPIRECRRQTDTARSVFS